MRSPKHTIGLLLAGSLLLVPIGMAQPDGRPPESQAGGEQPPREPRRPGMMLDDPEAIQKRLRSAIERGERVLARQREALERLEAGESPGEVMRTLRVSAIDRGTRDRSLPDESNPDPRDGRRTGDRRPARPDESGSQEMPSPPNRGELRAFLREHLPAMHNQLEKVEQTDQTAGERLFDRMAPRLADVALDMRRDPKLGSLRVDEMRAGLQVVEASQRYGVLSSNTDEDAVSSAETALKEAIGARFDAGVALRQYEVERLVARIGELNDEILAESASRDAEIERVFQEIVRRKKARGNGRGRRSP